MYAQSYLASQNLEYLAWCRALADQGKFQRYEQNMPGYGFLISGPKLEWYLCDERGWRSKYGWGADAALLASGLPDGRGAAPHGARPAHQGGLW